MNDLNETPLNPEETKDMQHLEALCEALMDSKSEGNLLELRVFTHRFSIGDYGKIRSGLSTLEQQFFEAVEADAEESELLSALLSMAEEPPYAFGAKILDTFFHPGELWAEVEEDEMKPTMDEAAMEVIEYFTERFLERVVEALETEPEEDL